MSDDVIYRQAAIDAFGDVHPLDYNAIAVRNRIKALPSAEPERKTGEWVTGEFTVESGECYCSVCETYYYAYDLMQIGESIYGIEKATLPNFCPNCGADMRGE